MALPEKWERLTTLNVEEILAEAYAEDKVTPKREDVFRAFELLEPEDVRVIIIGQDPYPTPGDADGLAFSTRAVKTPRSLANIFKVIAGDYPEADLSSNRLDEWAKQGVLLVNRTLTCREGEPNSHKGSRWEIMVHEIISSLVETQNPIVVAWGADAEKLANGTGSKRIISSSHPSPLSFSRGARPFKDSRMFYRINELLEDPIDWSTNKLNLESKQ